MKSGEYIPIHEVDLDASPKITVRVAQVCAVALSLLFCCINPNCHNYSLKDHKSSLNGDFTASKKPPEYMNFTVDSETKAKVVS